MKLTLEAVCSGTIRILTLTLLSIGVLTITAAAQEPYQADIDWAAGNTDHWGSVDCPDQYFSHGVSYAIASGGRAAVINAALFAAYNQDFDGAFGLVLLTQCHNSDARERLLMAGQKAVLTYLLNGYEPTGIDPNQVIGAAQKAIEVLAASN